MNEEAKNLINEITKLDPSAKMPEIISTVNALIERLETIKTRDRGPKSERSMTDEDAFRVKFGDLKDKSHKQAAEALGLSYGQVYSARGSYTFTHIGKDWNK